MKAFCSCQMFEFSGLCAHIMTVFRVTNVLTLPSHFILKRWTRNAQSGVILVEHAGGFLEKSEESLTVRYNNLRHEALKYADEGAKTFEIYNAAMEALQEAANKVSLAKNGGRLAPLNKTEREDGSHLGNQSRNNVETLSEDEQDKKMHKLERQLLRTRRKCEFYRASLLSVFERHRG